MTPHQTTQDLEPSVFKFVKINILKSPSVPFFQYDSKDGQRNKEHRHLLTICLSIQQSISHGLTQPQP